MRFITSYARILGYCSVLFSVFSVGLVMECLLWWDGFVMSSHSAVSYKHASLVICVEAL